MENEDFRDGIKLSFIIVNCNGKRFLRGCLDSLARQTKVPNEVIVIDNDSTDGSLELLSNKYPNVIVFEMGKNMGQIPALNEGLRIAKNDWVILSNEDLFLENDCIELLLRSITNNRSITVPRFVSMDPKHSVQNNPVKLIPSARHPWTSICLKTGSGRVYHTDIAGFGLLMFCKKETGFIDNRFPQYFAEDNFSLECLRRGMEILYVSDAIVYHYGGGAIGRLSVRKIRLFFYGWVRYRAKWFPSWTILPSLIFATVAQLYQHLLVAIGNDMLISPNAKVKE